MNVQLSLLDGIVATLPTRICLSRVDPARRMARFYVLAIEPTLFGGYALVREYGRIGRGGRVVSKLYGSADEAIQAFQRQRQVKERRGYA
ncbi:MAG: hypothetical protein RLZZ129_2292 [Verrucomicrobiota bacterium]|jgi:predicted DNA-binding WGR domain protein